MEKLDAKTAAKSWAWEVVDGGVAITKRVESRARKVAVPSEIDGKPVVAIGESAFFESKSPRQISLPATLRSIGEEAFGDCASAGFGNARRLYVRLLSLARRNFASARLANAWERRV